MLPRSQRLNLKKDFKWVAQGKKIETKYLKLFTRLGTNFYPKVGIANSSKTFNKSTDRNRARRLVSQALQTIYHQLPTTINIVVLPKAGILSVKLAEVLKDLEVSLKKERVILGSEATPESDKKDSGQTSDKIII